MQDVLSIEVLQPQGTRLLSDLAERNIIRISSAATSQNVSILHRDRPLTHFASERTLAKDWLNPIEDAAWHDL